MSDDVIFQTSVTATPPNATRIATDNLGGAHHQLVKVEFGDNGTAYGVSAGTPLPVILYGTTSGSVFGLGTFQILGTVQLHGTGQFLGTFQPLAGSVHVANPISGTVQTHGTSQALGTVQPLAGSVHIAAAIPAGDNNIGNVDVLTMPTVTVTATNLSVLGTVQTHGTSQVIGTVQLHGTVPLGTVAGTVQILGSVQPLAGSVHLASRLPGTADIGTIAGTVSVLGTVQPLAGSVHIANSLVVTIGTISGGTIQAFGTTEVLGTVRALTTVDVTIGTIAEGTVYAFGSVAHGAAAAGNPLLIGVFGSSGTQAAVDDGDSVRLWADLNGRLQVRGTIDSIPSITIGAALPAGDNNIGNVDVVTMPTVTVQATNLDIRDLTSASDSIAVVGTVQTHGTSQVLGTVQTVAGIFFGSVQGWQAHDGAVAGNPLLMAAFGSSGTQAAVGNGDAVRLWADLNGRLQTFGTVGSITPITVGAALPAGDNNIGNVDIVTMPTVTVTGTVQTHGTSQALGTYQPLAGSVHVANAISGTVRFLPPSGTVLGETYFSTIYTAAANDVSIIAAPGAGTFIRIYDIMVSGSAAGTFRVLDSAEGTHMGHGHFAANGGWSFSSNRGVRTRAGNRAILIDCTTGTWGLLVNYALETA